MRIRAQIQIRLVCFDWGGVILRIVKNWNDACERAGVRPFTGDLTVGAKAKIKELSHSLQCGETPDAEFCAELAETHAGFYSAEEIARVHRAWLVDEYAGVGDLVAELIAKPNLLTGLLSNTCADHWARRLTDFPTASRLHHQHASHLLRFCKPDVEIYRAFETATNVAGDSILFFDDTRENIAAAREHGWNAELIDPHRDTAAQMREHLARYGVLSPLASR